MIDYNLGPGFVDEYRDDSLFVYVKTYEDVRETKDIIGYIEGAEEPDKYVIIGRVAKLKRKKV